MSEHPEEVLTGMGITLPEAPAPAAAYQPFMRDGDLLYTAGQIAVGPDKAFVATGIVGDAVTLEVAQACARQCAINTLAQIKAACGDLANVEQIIKLTVFVASTPTFTDQHLVANGASNFLFEVLGEPGRHARSAVGVPCLPLGSPVEIEAIVKLRG